MYPALSYAPVLRRLRDGTPYSLRACRFEGKQPCGRGLGILGSTTSPDLLTGSVAKNALGKAARDVVSSVDLADLRFAVVVNCEVNH